MHATWDDSPAKKMTGRKTVVHVVYSFSVGGLENVIVQLINRLPKDKFAHVVLSLTSIGDIKDRVQDQAVRYVALHKPQGHAVSLYPRIWSVLREIRPDVLHSCNLAALEVTPVAWLAGIPLRVHAEHGWDAHDPDGQNRKYRWIRRLYQPFVSQYVAVSADISRYLLEAVGISRAKVVQVENGVDTDAFRPTLQSGVNIPGCPFDPAESWLVGTIGRMQTVKNQPLLARAFVRVLQQHPEAARKMRLVMVGDGALRPHVESILEEAGVKNLAWLAGTRNDVDKILPHLKCFVLPSVAEGTSCTLQEAMACGVPAVATDVGGNPGLVLDGRNGYLVPSQNVAEMASAIWKLYSQPELAARFGAESRLRAEQNYGMDAMVARYEKLFSPE
jgi:sugar transferase (PEP-CTERM/EpsH1 system associated)